VTKLFRRCQTEFEYLPVRTPETDVRW